MLPLKRLDGKTPAELWTGKKPNIEIIRIYGSKAYAHINEQFRSKFDPKSKQMILVGYEPKRKAYRLWLPGSKRVEVSRDAIIVEPTPKQQAILIPKNVNESSILDSDYKAEGHRKEEEKPSKSIEESTSKIENVPIAMRTRKKTKDLEDEEEVIYIDEKPGESKDKNRAATHLAVSAIAFIANVTIPQTVEEARSSSDKEQWEQSMNSELKALKKNNTYTLVEPPPNCRPIKNRWVSRIKTHPDRSVDK